MKFDVYFTVTTKDGKKVPGTKPKSMEWSAIERDVLGSKYVSDCIVAYRGGDKSAKPMLPAINFVGRSVGTRKADQMIPTQLFMIDIDHCEDPKGSWEKLRERIREKFGVEWLDRNLVLAHITPSGKGLHLFFVQQGFNSLKENMDYMNEQLGFDDFGEYDSVVKDFARVSFAFLKEEMLYASTWLYLNTEPEWGDSLVNYDFKGADEVGSTPKEAQGQNLFQGVTPFTDDEVKAFEEMEYRGTLVKVIVNKYIETVGEPTSGEIHNFYNELVKNFRCITSNNKRALLYLLPQFGHTYDECWSQIQSITRYNTLSRLPKDFYFFLKDNGFYQDRRGLKALIEEEEEETQNDVNRPPYLPPVFRELVGTAPADFVVPCVNALLPILGTLSSYVGAVYPYDNRVHTTSFFSIVYAPPGTGKGFVERFIDLLFEDLKLRDFVQSERENIYLRVLSKKGANDKAPDMPHTSLRIIPPKNSEAEFLQKQRDNHGYHMFTFAAEMDSWAKGVKAAGGNKDDMIRIAWDNGEYGQQFKSFNTFKGMTKLYWNVLITGTPLQVDSYFKNVENGLVTRCSFTGIENQEYAVAPHWKKISARGLANIRKYMERCDSNTYEDPCDLTVDQLASVNDDDFDKEINWRFKFKERKMVDLWWIMPTIEKFHEEQRQMAARNVDEARDVFRRRVGVRGFRLALLCMTLWDKPRVSDLEKCKLFIDWWMHQDIESMLKLWGEKYNDSRQPEKKITQRYIFTELPETFTTTDVYMQATKQGVKTAPRRILFDWKKIGLITEESKGHFKKRKV